MKFKLQNTLDYLYPAVCHFCNCKLNDSGYLCEICTDNLPQVQPPFCSKCGECYDGAIDGPFYCPNCTQLKLHFDFAVAAYQDTEKSLNLIHDFKYNRQIHLSRDIARLTTEALSDPRFSPYLQDAFLIPVPLHWRRYSWRQFNQSEEIAQQIAKTQPELTSMNVLKRDRHTKTQTSFSRAMRLKNLHGAFSIRKKYQHNIKNKHIILIDDVFTTGSTANECSKTLLLAGAKNVAILTFLRG